MTLGAVFFGTALFYFINDYNYMANDGEIKIGTKIDESQLDKGLKSVQNKVNNTSKTMGSLTAAFKSSGGAAASFTQKMSGVAASGGLVAAGITAAIAVAKAYIEALKEASEAYKVQEKAEKALAQAAKNNPYLDDESVAKLKAYAGELQEISNYGDEGSIDIMAQLAATGRNESEIMKIMGAAADYAAAKHIDLASAAQTLNATYSGSAGLMGKQIDELKNLTEEQLKNGDAIDLISKKYKGFAAEAKDSATQAKNALGDFMEQVGKFSNKGVENFYKIAKGFWELMGKGMEAFNKALESASRNWAIGGINRDVKAGVNAVTKRYQDESGETINGAKVQSDEYLKWLKAELELKGKLNEKQKEALFNIDQELKYRERVAAYEQQQADAEAKRQEALKQQADAKKKADEYAAASNKKLQESLAALEAEAKAKGQAVSAQDRYNVYLQSYIDLLTKTDGMIREGYPIEQKRLEQLKEAKKALDEAADGEEKLAAAMKYTQAATEAINSIKRELTPAAEMQKAVEEMESLKAKIKEMSDAEIAAAQAGQEKQLSKTELLAGLQEAEKQLIKEKVGAVAAIEQSWWDKYASKQQELLELKKAIDESEVLSEEEKVERMKEIDEAYKQSKLAQLNEIMSQINSYTSQTVGVINNAANLMIEATKNQAKAEQAELEKKYKNGEISEEEYNEAITESKRKAAKEQYKIQMVQWAASILQATANIAQGVTQAIAQGGVAGIVTGAIVAAAGAVQIASIIASKPTPPSFSTGGIIGGSSYHGDNIAANLNSREMVMNQAQQKGLWDFINGGSNGAGNGANIVINNSAANIVNAQPQITRGQIEIMIDARVNDSLKNGRYNNSLSQAQQGMSGDFYGI